MGCVDACTTKGDLMKKGSEPDELRCDRSTEPTGHILIMSAAIAKWKSNPVSARAASWEEDVGKRPALARMKSGGDCVSELAGALTRRLEEV